MRHQLYDSLTTTFDVHGNYHNSSSSSSSATDDRYGVGLARIITSGSATGGIFRWAEIVADHEDHNSSGSVLTVVDEQHYLTNYRLS